MKDNKKTVIVVLIGIIILALMYIFILPESGKSLSIMRLENKLIRSWTSNYGYMHGVRKGKLKGKSDNLHIEVESQSGSLEIEVSEVDGDVIFSKKFEESEILDIKVPNQVSIIIKATHHKGGYKIKYDDKISYDGEISTGKIYLYGEKHSVKKILDKELELWGDYYNNHGMRHLFIEFPYFGAEYFNLWLAEDNDDILDQMFEDFKGTAGATEDVKNFFKVIKRDMPETIFHGTDIGHAHETTGKRYLEYLIENGLEDSEKFKLTKENIEQAELYYSSKDDIFRENTMTENFIREFNSLVDEDIMGIYGGAHTNPEALDYITKSVPSMAMRLKEIYKDNLYTEDLSLLASSGEVISTDKVVIGGKEYATSYFGEEDISSFAKGLKSRKFWRIEDAYDDFKNNKKTGDFLPYNNYPMQIEKGEVFLLEYTKTNGSILIKYYRSDGNDYQGLPTTEEFILK